MECHNALVETERYHAYLCNFYERVIAEHPDLDLGALLQLAVKPCSDTSRPAGMVPLLLVFGVIPRGPVHPNELPQQQEQMTALHRARIIMADLIANAWLNKAFGSHANSMYPVNVKIGDYVLVLRDVPDSWIGPDHSV